MNYIGITISFLTSLCFRVITLKKINLKLNVQSLLMLIILNMKLLEIESISNN